MTALAVLLAVPVGVLAALGLRWVFVLLDLSGARHRRLAAERTARRNAERAVELAKVAVL